MITSYSNTDHYLSMLAILTTTQRTVLAQQWKRIARSLNEYQVAHWADLTLEQQLDVNAYQNSLLGRAYDLEDGLTQPAFVNVEQMLATVCELTQRAVTELTHITSLPLALNIGAISVALAATIARSNAKGMNNALQELTSLLDTDQFNIKD